MKTFRRLLLLVAAASLSSAAPVRAAIVAYNIDETLSSLTLTGSIFGQPFSEQSPGSLVDFWDGTIIGDLVGDTLSFSGGSDVRALLHASAPFLPTSGGVANYGVAVPGILGVAAFRDLAFDFTTGSITNGMAPTGSGVTVLSGGMDYFVQPATSGFSSSAGKTATNIATALVSLSISGNIETLSLPYRTTNTGSNGLVQTFTGTLVATRPVPEPSSAALLLCGVAALVRRRRSPVEADSR